MYVYVCIYIYIYTSISYLLYDELMPKHVRAPIRLVGTPGEIRDMWLYVWSVGVMLRPVFIISNRKTSN